jgi:hypothetical protein
MQGWLASAIGTRHSHAQCFKRLNGGLMWLPKCKLDVKKRFKEVRHIP